MLLWWWCDPALHEGHSKACISASFVTSFGGMVQKSGKNMRLVGTFEPQYS